MTDDKAIEAKVLKQLDSLIDEDIDKLKEGLEDVIPDYSGLLSDLSNTSEIKEGTTLGSWKVIKHIGQGGMSNVFLVERDDGQIQLQAALKVIPQGMASQSLKDRFQRERQILTDLNHSNIAKFYDAGVTEQGVPWFVMEYIDGKDIISYALENKLNIEQRIMLFKQVCDALTYAHSQGIVHRDIKPSNLMVNHEKTVKLLDFGIAASDENASLTMTGVIVGTPGFLSPEQARGLTHDIDRRSDIFSLGVLFYKLLQHEMPFQANSISEISFKTMHAEPAAFNKSVPKELQAIIYKCLEKKVENRYSSTKELIADINAYLNGDVVLARKVTLLLRLSKKIKKHPVLSAFIVIAVMSIVFALAYGVYQNYETLRKVQTAEKHLSKAEEINAKVRRTHMMPKHNVQQEYQQISNEIEQLRMTIESDNANTTGLSSFALGSAYLAMNDQDKALEFLLDAERKGWHSTDLSAALGIIYANKWQQSLLHSQGISDIQAREKYLQQQKKLIYAVAVKHLSASQSGLSISNYLAAKLAFIEKNYDKAIELIEKEIKVNPWHYEAMAFAATIYNQKYIKIGDTLGYENATKYKVLSDQRLQQAVEIGDSDPLNYVQYCQNMMTDVRKGLNELTESIYQPYEKAVAVCKDALLLDPDATQPYLSLGTIYEDMADYLELKKETFYQMEANSYFIIKEGLSKHPNEASLLAASVSSLFSLALQTDVIQEKDPNTLNDILKSFDITFDASVKIPERFFLQALKNINQALKMNPKSLNYRKSHAVVHRAFGIYYEEQIGDYNKADFHYDESLNSFKMMQDLGGKIASIGNVAEMYYNKALLSNLQGKPDESINYLKQAIELNAQVLKITQAKFAAYNNTMQFQYEMVETLVENNRPYKQYLDEYFQFVNVICHFDYLEKLHWYIIDDIIDSYTKLGINTKNKFPVCEAQKRKYEGANSLDVQK